MTETVQKRLYVGGLFEGATSDDIKWRFESFGEVDGIDFKIKKDPEGKVFQTFAFVNIKGEEKKIKKCITTYNKTKWKGHTLLVQESKESFLDKLKKEQEAPIETTPKVEVTEASPAVKHTDKKKSSKEGNVLHIRTKDKSKIVAYDPSKYSNGHKKFKDAAGEPIAKPITELTRSIDDVPESENYKKRKGIFPEYHSKKKALSKEDQEYVKMWTAPQEDTTAWVPPPITGLTRPINVAVAESSEESDTNFFKNLKQENAKNEKNGKSNSSAVNVNGSISKKQKKEMKTKETAPDSDSSGESDTDFFKSLKQNNNVEIEKSNAKNQMNLSTMSVNGKVSKKQKKEKKTTKETASDEDAEDVEFHEERMNKNEELIEKRAKSAKKRTDQVEQYISSDDDNEQEEKEVKSTKKEKKKNKKSNNKEVADNETTLPQSDISKVHNNNDDDNEEEMDFFDMLDSGKVDQFLQEHQEHAPVTETPAKEPTAIESKPDEETPTQPKKKKLSKSEKKKLRDTEATESKPEESKPEESKPEESKPEESKLEESKPEEDTTQPKKKLSKSEKKKFKLLEARFKADSKPEESKSEESKPEKEPKKKLSKAEKKKLKLLEATTKDATVTESKPDEETTKPKKIKLTKAEKKKLGIKPGDPKKLKHEKSEEQRQAAMNQRAKEAQQRKNIVRKALTAGAGLNKRIVFGDNDEAEATKHREETEEQEEQRTLPEKKSADALRLFDSDSADDSEEASDEGAIKINPQFGGKKGAKVLKLQQQVDFIDSRFKVTEDFIESSSSESEEEEEEMEVEEEKAGKKGKKKEKPSYDAIVRYDPTKPDDQNPVILEFRRQQKEKEEKKKQKEEKKKLKRKREFSDDEENEEMQIEKQAKILENRHEHETPRPDLSKEIMEQKTEGDFSVFEKKETEASPFSFMFGSMIDEEEEEQANGEVYSRFLALPTVEESMDEESNASRSEDEEEEKEDKEQDLVVKSLITKQTNSIEISLFVESQSTTVFDQPMRDNDVIDEGSRRRQNVEFTGDEWRQVRFGIRDVIRPRYKHSRKMNKKRNKRRTTFQTNTEEQCFMHVNKTRSDE